MAKVSLPKLIPVPPSTVRSSVAPEEWEACLNTWLTLVDLYLRLPSFKFTPSVYGHGDFTVFLHSFYHEAASAGNGDFSFNSTPAQKLKRICFRLTRRICSEVKDANGMLNIDFLNNFCQVHARAVSLSQLMDELWQQHDKVLNDSILQKRSTLVKAMESLQPETILSDLQSLPHVMLASPRVAASFLTGSDFLDALALAYTETPSADIQKAVTVIAYLALQSLVKIDPPNFSLLTDHLYSLKALADKKANATSLIADLVTNTALLTKLRNHAGAGGGERLLKLLDSLETYRSSTTARPRKHASKPSAKKKGKAAQRNDEMHMHRMSLVTQIQDLFPDLGSGFVLKLLDEYGDNVEQVTAHLLDDSLPAHLRELDRTEQAPIFDTSEGAELEHFLPRSTPPPPESYIPERRNVFDNDELDRLEVDTARLHIGKKVDETGTVQPNKAAILSALAAFDSDDDERDDTYDVEDVGGTVDTPHPEGEADPSAKLAQAENDLALFAAFKAAPQIFGRSPDVRRGQPRQALKAETGMTDEAIEGWAVMLQRDPKRFRRLEAQASSFGGQQGELPRTAYRESPGGTETEDSDTPGGRGSFRGRGRGRGKGGRGRGDAAGPTSDPNTAAAQRNKEANKGSRANHNRRDQRARKMARGGFPG